MTDIEETLNTEKKLTDDAVRYFKENSWIQDMVMDKYVGDGRTFTEFAKQDHEGDVEMAIYDLGQRAGFVV